MDGQTIREWMRRKPFVPYRLVLTNGRTIDVRFPFGTIMPLGNDVYVGTKVDGEGRVDDARFVPYVEIANIEPIAEPTPQTSNA